ncbi:MAG: alpha/beta hydrolase [Nitratireductor sp.]|nr:alpha/beta hydrolase [Nitratireductor sp.]
MNLFESGDNKIPPNPISGTVRTRDGITLRYAHWRTARPPAKGTVIILHGRTEFIEKYYETIQDLREAGYEALTFDWRGQGGSDRLLANPRRGHVESFDQYVMDLDTILKEIALPDCRGPLFILAHSTGGLVALTAAPALGNRIERMVLTSPLIGFGEFGLSSGTLRFVTGLMCTAGLGSIPFSRKSSNADALRDFASNQVTSDTKRFTRNSEFLIEHDELAIDGPTAGWLFAAGQAMRRIHDPDFIASISVPTLLISAGSDTVVSNRAIEDYGKRLRSGRAVQVAGSKHEILQERDVLREQAMAAIKAFLPGNVS